VRNELAPRVIMRTYHVYILSSLSRRLYVGSTSNLVRRVQQHRTKHFRGHTAMYRIERLVHYESAPDVSSARARERQLKGWTRARKISLIESTNAGWWDLSLDWLPRDGAR
jgi:putative endonuclease